MASNHPTVVVTGACGFIGLNLCRHLAGRGYRVLAVDREPRNPSLRCDQFFQLDLKDYAATRDLLDAARPDWLLHLAARTDLGGSCLAEYMDNIVPTWNLLRALELVSSRTRVVAFSSMLEDTPRSSPAFHYGLSKKRAEEICAGFAAFLRITVVRPPSVWGPHFREPYLPFFESTLAGRFVYCSLFEGRKTFSYVGNLGAQIEAILTHQAELPPAVYLGDAPPLSANEFAEAIAAERGIRLRSVPGWLILLLALTGSGLSLFRIRFPMTMFRLRNMRKGRVVDVAPIGQVSKPGTDLHAAVRETIAWMDSR